VKERFSPTEDRFRELFEQSPDALCVAVNDRIVYANRATSTLLRAEKTEALLGRSLFEFIHPDFQPVVRAGLQRLAETSESLTFEELKILGLDQKVTDVEIRFARADWDGEPGIHVTLRERTSRGAVENSLHALIHATQDAVVTIDRQARIVVFNPAAERIFGYSRSEVQGKKVNILMAEPYASEHDGYIKHYETTGEKRAIGRVRTVAGKRKDGDIFPIELSIAQVASGEEVNYAAFIRDISEKSRLESQLLEHSRLATIGATASKMAHEIGNPLNGMYISAQLLERYLNKEGTLPDKKISSTFHSITGELKRLNVLLEEFRSFYRSDRYDLRPISLATVAEEVLALQRAHYINRGILVEQSIPADLPPVMADSDKLKQVFLNLCKNAVEAMSEGGKLILRATKSSKDALVEVTDTGSGIPEGIDIWAPFTSTKGRGTGLGLMIVRQIVADHRGTITYSSESGKGTTFRITLPLSSPG
jgi:PAS domain S-box-containing protein